MNPKKRIALHFYGGKSEIYQIKQWLSVLEVLHKSEALEIIVRDKSVFSLLPTLTNLDVIFLPTADELISYYVEQDFHIILYINNGAKNFHSLAYPRSIHIQLHHGESEKTSTHSNQIKGYDYAFIAGEAALDRYTEHLINIQRVHFIQIGRPQFDHIVPPIKPKNKKIILYAPTDESTHISMRYTSIQEHGLKIVEAILAHPDYHLIYRPHPRTGHNDPKVKRAHNTIIHTVRNAPNGSIETTLPALEVLSMADIGIFDNSSLLIDFLFFDKPILLTDMFLTKYHDPSSFRMSQACIMLNKNNIDKLTELLQRELTEDTFQSIRRKVRYYYLGVYKKGESTSLFISKIQEIIEERRTLLLKEILNIPKK